MLDAKARDGRDNKICQRDERTPWVAAVTSTMTVLQATRASEGISANRRPVSRGEASAASTAKPGRDRPGSQSQCRRRRTTPDPHLHPSLVQRRLRSSSDNTSSSRMAYPAGAPGSQWRQWGELVVIANAADVIGEGSTWHGVGGERTPKGSRRRRVSRALPI